MGRTEVRIKDVLDQSGDRRGPITKRLILHEVETGEVVVKLDLQLFETQAGAATGTTISPETQLAPHLLAGNYMESREI